MRSKAVDVHVVPVGALSAAELGRWSAIQRSADELASPYFRPEFTQIVADVRDDAYVALLEPGGEAQGFFPYLRGRFGIGQPIGSLLSDYHGVIASPDVTVPDGRALIAACGLRLWRFHCLPADQLAFQRHARELRASHVIDLSDGYEAYREARRQAGRGTISKVERKERRLERECGTVSFMQHCTDVESLEALFEWKSAQYRRTARPDLIARPWVQRVLRRVHASQTPLFAGVLSTLHVDGRLIAAHLGMRSDRTLHYWFPAYDPSFARYSPGLILLLRIARSAPGSGLTRIDLGVGETEFKLKLSNADVKLSAGVVETPSLVAGAFRSREAATAVARRSALAREVRRRVYRGRSAIL
jgi:CelD/BcsL family acetyltransferase involved in cellulose biosynthesis